MRSLLFSTLFFCVTLSLSTINIDDGTLADWSTNELFLTSDNNYWGFTWDSSNFYIAYNATRVGYLNQTIFVHFETDLNEDDGISIGYRSGVSLPFRADFCLFIDDINNGTLAQAIGLSWSLTSYTDLCIIGPSVIECEIPFSYLNIHANSSIKIEGFQQSIVDSSPCSTFFIPPESYPGCVPSTPTATNYYGFALVNNAYIYPNNPMHLNTFTVYVWNPSTNMSTLSTSRTTLYLDVAMNLPMNNYWFRNLVLLDNGGLYCAQSPSWRCSDISTGVIMVSNNIIADAGHALDGCNFRIVGSEFVLFISRTTDTLPPIRSLTLNTNSNFGSGKIMTVNCTMNVMSSTRTHFFPIVYGENATLQYQGTLTVDYNEWGPRASPSVVTIVSGTVSMQSAKSIPMFADVLKIQNGGGLLVDDQSYFYGNISINSLILETGSILQVGNTCDFNTRQIYGNTSGVLCLSEHNLLVNGTPFNRDTVSGNFTIYLRTDGSVYIPAKLMPTSQHDSAAWYMNDTLLSLSSTFEVIEPGTYHLLVNDKGCQAVTSFQVKSLVVNVTDSNGTVGGATTGTIIYETKKKERQIGGIVGGTIAVICFLVCITALVVFIVQRRTEKEYVSNALELEEKSVTKIKDVRILNRLGGGTYSDVYKGEWQGNVIALKKFRFESQMKDFMVDAVAFQALNNPNVVRFLGIHHSPANERYIVTEFMYNGALNTFLQGRDGQFTGEELVDFARQAASGMKFLEENGIIHRDLALRNVLITGGYEKGKYVVKIGDLGQIKVGESAYPKAERKPVPIKWSAPEVYMLGKITSKSDVFSFGVVLWEIFSYGRLPYPSYNNEQVIDRVSSGYRMPPPWNMPEDIVKIMEKCWLRMPDERPTFEQVVDMFAVKKEENPPVVISIVSEV